MAVVD